MNKYIVVLKETKMILRVLEYKVYTQLAGSHPLLQLHNVERDIFALKQSEVCGEGGDSGLFNTLVPKVS